MEPTMFRTATLTSLVSLGLLVPASVSEAQRGRATGRVSVAGQGGFHAGAVVPGGAVIHHGSHHGFKPGVTGGGKIITGGGAVIHHGGHMHGYPGFKPGVVGGGQIITGNGTVISGGLLSGPGGGFGGGKIITPNGTVISGGLFIKK
jgi:hypothetical protein